MTTTGTADPPLIEDDDGEPSVPSRRRRPAPRSHPFWRFVFPILVVAAGIAVFFVWRAGTKAVLDSTDGREVEVITDPAAPGYVAFVEPTPTLLIVHVDDSTLVGVSVLARTALDNGGTLVLVSADMLIAPEDGLTDPILLTELYANEGLAGLERRIGDLFGFGFRETLEIETDSLRQWLRLVEPIPYNLVDDLIEGDGNGGESTFLEAGFADLDGETAAQLYRWRNPGEFDVNRSERQLRLWRAWLREIDAAEEILAATLPFEDGLSPYLRSLGTSPADLSILPLVSLQFEDAAPIYALDDAGAEWLHAKALEMVPLPVSSHTGARPSVSLLDGTGDRQIRDRMLPVIVAAGAEISIIGNALAFDVTDTVVIHHSVETEQAAIDLAAAIGADVLFEENPDSPSDLTVTIGTDQEA